MTLTGQSFSVIINIICGVIVSYIKSPLNYTGGKYQLLNDLMSIFPHKINTFVDLFCGGLNVSINTFADKIISNDINTQLIDLYEYFKNVDSSSILDSINEIILKYNLSKDNKEGYIELRNFYNSNKSSVHLFALICYSFNHMIRFNDKGEYNVPFGKDRSSFNSSIEKNLINFLYRLKELNISFMNIDFRKFDYSSLKEGDLVYCDPPYLISNASYNKKNGSVVGWGEKEELDLLNILTNLHNNKVSFILSNVIEHKGNTNTILQEWSKDFYTINLNKKYSNCSYNLLHKDTKTQEVIITNIKQDCVW